MAKARKFSEKELQAICSDIAKPLFKYFVRRIESQILDNPKNHPMDMNTFMSINSAALAAFTANGLRWVESFYLLQTGENFDFEKLRVAFTNNLYKDLKIILQ